MSGVRRVWLSDAGRIFRPSSRNATGFSLVELLVAIAIISVLVMLAAPEVGNIIKGSRLRSASSDLMVDLMLARSEALKRGARVVVCSSSNGTGCRAEADMGGDQGSDSFKWEIGWLIFVDSNSNGSVDTGETILKVSESLASGLRLTLSKVGGGALSSRQIGFKQSGFSDAGGGVEFALCDSRGPKQGRLLTLGTTGRIESKSISDATKTDDELCRTVLGTLRSQ